MKIFYRLLPIISVLFLTIFFSCIATSCNTTEPPTPSNGTLTLSQVDVSCTEAWVNLKANGVTFPVNVNFSANGSTIAHLNNLSNADTTIYIDSLLPNRSYQLQVQFVKDNNTTSSNKLTVQTLDTTSNNFSWQTYTFGASNAGSSSLNDVAIINDNDIWAVGEIYMDDSTGQPDPQPYCIAKWNGQSWLLERISFNLYNYDCTLAGSYYGTAKAVYSFYDNVIIFTDGADFVKYDGNTYSHLPCVINLLNGSIQKIWGNSSNDFYAVGTLGTIIHFNGNSWQKIESGTTTDINDIWGYYDKTNNNQSVMAVVSNIHSLGEYRLFSISGNSAKDTLNWPYTNSLAGLLFQRKYSPVYICGSGIKEYKQGVWNQLNLPNYFTESIRGSAVNDVIAVGDYGFITHFNGVRWNSENLANNYVFYSVAINNKTVAIAGVSTSGVVVGSAVVVIGTR